MEKKTYDAAFKREAIRLVEEQGEEPAAVAKKLGGTGKTMYRWANEYRQDGNDAFPGKGYQKPEDAELRRLKREKSGGHLCKTPKIKYIFMYDFRSTFMVKRMAKAVKTSTSGYYEWLKNGRKTKRDTENEKYLPFIRIEFNKSRQTYGPRRLSKALIQTYKLNIGRTRVRDIMAENNIVPKTVIKFKATTYSNHDYPVAPNLLNRNFQVKAANMAWVSDITYISTREGWLYLAAVMDLYCGKVIGWAMDKQMTQNLVIAALKQAVGRERPPRGIILHSDRGVQYAF